MSKTTATDKEEKEDNSCFIIMPIADADGYESGHFKRVYQDILKPACEQAGFSPIRADDVQQTNLIHLDILKKLIDSPMAICDLSNRNPNVLFELGIRQAFDKPTVLIQEVGTPKIFDISILRYVEYRKELKYREVLEDQKAIAENLKATKIAKDKKEGVNSIISLLSLSTPASLKDISEKDNNEMLQYILAEMGQLRKDFNSSQTNGFIINKKSSPKNVKSDSDDINELYSIHERLATEILRLISEGQSANMVYKFYRNFKDINDRLVEINNIGVSFNEMLGSKRMEIENAFASIV